MKSHRIILWAVLGFGLPGIASTAAAQTPGVSRAGTRPAADILARIGQAAGVVAVADSTVANERVPLPETAATLETVEQQIAAVVKALPPGTTWARLYLPAPPSGRPWSGDDVAAYVFAQARLFGNVGAAPAGTIEILGQRLSAGQAQPHIAGLKLKPVYLVTNPSRRTQGGSAAAEPWSPVTRQQWSEMTREAQKAYGQQQAAQILSLPPEMRQEVLRQMKQQDRFFDSIKDPLEKLLGFEL